MLFLPNVLHKLCCTRSAKTFLQDHQLARTRETALAKWASLLAQVDIFKGDLTSPHSTWLGRVSHVFRRSGRVTNLNRARQYDILSGSYRFVSESRGNGGSCAAGAALDNEERVAGGAKIRLSCLCAVEQIGPGGRQMAMSDTS